MNEYTKINTIWKRDERGRIVEGDYSIPEFAGERLVAKIKTRDFK